MSTTELIVIVLIILLLFGGKKIPELMKGLGKGVKSFKEGLNEVEKDLNADSTNPGETTFSSPGKDDKKADNNS